MSSLIQSAASSSSASLPNTPIKSLTNSWHSNSDYFSIKPQLSLDINASQELYSNKSNQSRGSDSNGEEEEKEDDDDEGQDDDDADSVDLSDVMETFDDISLHEEEDVFYSPITPFDSSAVPSKSNSLIRRSSILRPSSQQGVFTVDSTETKEQQQPASKSESKSSTKFHLSMPNLHSYKFLIVDDNVINLKILNRILLKLYPKASITQVQDSTLVEQIIFNQSFDSIFIDIEMPEVTGLDIAQVVRNDSQFTTTSLIAVTTRNTQEDLSLFKQYGIDYTFGKPLNYKLDFMAETIDGVMQQRKNSTTNPQSRNLSTSSKSTCATAATTITSATGSTTAIADFMDLTAVHSVSSISSTDSYTLFESRNCKQNIHTSYED
ncbi:SRR1 [Candida margitis]|uniref:SRR1 n=1 Tax=Candida margitis TaxID=1775924 RepID=UPI002226ACFB|nr:SRR1 [Candida margitis]KAI5968229.1 SRR1 [Candida margitis]